ncbi:MAG: hypothetical protein A2161_18055 [Candidatus Schekmanbacteria bacterium RBG_13_48_7]|uniref:Uncharacterized protein n=1 Tax=Candidatus Schekmanbacteria bacterium RBG_13_48_7 TaxID=1817878 RepID=A0A1F7RTA2_9BACT|nr:MAG: hypothetical protein A2161_18055 [Candidatus Schekmanbacteria bacterium RBG_13_48_7]
MKIFFDSMQNNSSFTKKKTQRIEIRKPIADRIFFIYSPLLIRFRMKISLHKVKGYLIFLL